MSITMKRERERERERELYCGCGVVFDTKDDDLEWQWIEED
jgi:hypothetical protein